jgi:hypothetical protein
MVEGITKASKVPSDKERLGQKGWGSLLDDDLASYSDRHSLLELYRSM